MPRSAVSAAVDARLAANWTATPVIAYDAVTQPPTDEDAFLVVQFPIVNGEKPVLGRLFWETGAIRFVLSIRRDLGKSEGELLADELADLFREVKFAAGESFIQTGTPDGPILDDASTDGNFLVLSLIVPYRYEYAEP